MDKLNVYQKLNKARVELASKDIKKSGHNKHLGFRYSELDDFINPILAINNGLGIMSQFTLKDDMAIMVIINCDAPTEQIYFESPVAKATLQGKPSPIQELGAQHTYMRRYMYQMTYEITEGDSIDGNAGAPEEELKQPTAPTKSAYITDNQANSLAIKANEKQVNMSAILANYKIESLEKMTQAMLEHATKYLNSKEV